MPDKKTHFTFCLFKYEKKNKIDNKLKNTDERVTVLVANHDTACVPFCEIRKNRPAPHAPILEFNNLYAIIYTRIVLRACIMIEKVARGQMSKGKRSKNI